MLLLAGFAAILAAAVAGFVYLTDPFQVVRRASGAPHFYPVAQYQNAGIARHYAHDAVVVGTSTSNNFRAADVADAFGWQAINLSMAGSTIREQRAVLDTALATGRVRRVLWGIDPFAFALDRHRSFPYYLYGRVGWRTAPYFLSLGALSHGVAALWLPADKRTSLAHWVESTAWDRQYTYGRAQVQTAWAHRHALAGTDLPHTPELAARAVRATVAQLAAEYPGIEFRVVLLPYTVLYSTLLLERRPREFEASGWIAAGIVEQLGASANAAVFDFRDVREITHDLDAFKDLRHFSGEVSRRILADVAAGRRRATPESCARATAALRAAAHAISERDVFGTVK